RCHDRLVSAHRLRHRRCRGSHPRRSPTGLACRAAGVRSMMMPKRAYLSGSPRGSRPRIRRAPSLRVEDRAPLRTPALRLAMACGLGVASAVLVSCGSSGKGLIPAADAGPLQNDFVAVASDARDGAGSCAATEAALAQTEHDFGALPASLDPGLRERLQTG